MHALHACHAAWVGHRHPLLTDFVMHAISLILRREVAQMTEPREREAREREARERAAKAREARETAARTRWGGHVGHSLVMERSRF